ncbi:30S ribosomal protein S16 [Pigmentibacter sp. JX0631]|uniref:30S ribosomal protein S16 n=1 Tax=Pigmentibacter sp. JX0631 TaxID=2976982 RepID=UPI0024682DAC|nr:30S ribosomal protein S16 [Pigmentibacter sp. JX0631]WGL60895.1 30S ribosomal protein S16 [Pigmentibacter sp. JX0631]
MALKFRLQRLGNKGRPFYHVVVTDSRNARNGRFIERVGYYNPMPAQSEVELKTDRLVHWYGVGCRPTDSVANLLKIKKVDLAALTKR